MSTKLPTERETAPASRSVLNRPLSTLHDEIDRLFDDFMGGTDRWWPRLERRTDGMMRVGVDVSESEKEIEVTADLPGMEEKDLEVTLANGVLTIKGEREAKKEEKDEKKTYHRLERSYGTYLRSVALPCDVRQDKVKAKFSKGVLTVTLPKSEKEKSKIKKIEIKGD